MRATGVYTSYHCAHETVFTQFEKVVCVPTHVSLRPRNHDYAIDVHEFCCVKTSLAMIPQIYQQLLYKFKLCKLYCTMQRNRRAQSALETIYDVYTI